eukprot:925033-Ditylum_brightwellii.AAC.1
MNFVKAFLTTINLKPGGDSDPGICSQLCQCSLVSLLDRTNNTDKEDGDTNSGKKQSVISLLLVPGSKGCPRKYDWKDKCLIFSTYLHSGFTK